MDNKGKNYTDIKTKGRGFFYYIRKFFNFLPVETTIKTPDSSYGVEIRISQRKLKKIVDEVCLRAISSL